MTDDAAKLADRRRRAHTVYLTEEVWQALGRRHLELRLQGTAPDSKIEFVEQVLRMGLAAIGPKGKAPAAWETKPAGQPHGTEAAVAAVDKADEQPRPAPGYGPAAHQADEAEPTANARPQSTPRRTTVMDRLLQASDPGRPAPIRSAADPAPSA